MYVDDFVINVRSLCGFMKINFQHPHKLLFTLPQAAMPYKER